MKARLPQGYGKQNMNDLMKQAQMMQDQMAQKQQELSEMEYHGSSGDGVVQITMTGNHEVVSVKIDPQTVQADEVDMLEDLLAAAFNEAVREVDETSAREMAAISSAYNIPGL